jgi:hypothetical protein
MVHPAFVRITETLSLEREGSLFTPSPLMGEGKGEGG